MFLDAQSTQASADDVIVRRPIVLGGDPIDIVQEAVHIKEAIQNVGEARVSPNDVTE